MSEESIETAISTIATQIEALDDKDFDMFKLGFSPKILNILNMELFEKAIELHSKIPLNIEMIDKEASEILTSSHIKLILKNGRPLCNLIKEGFDWLIDDIYWKHDKSLIKEIEPTSEEAEEKSENETEIESDESQANTEDIEEGEAEVEVIDLGDEELTEEEMENLEEEEETDTEDE